MIKNTPLPPFMEKGFEAFKQCQFSSFNTDTIMSAYQKNMEFMKTAQDIMTETTKSISELQNQFFKDALEQWTEQMKVGASASPLDNNPKNYGNTTVDKTIEHARKINETLVKSNEKIIGAAQKHFKDVLHDSANAAKKDKSKH